MLSAGKIFIAIVAIVAVLVLLDRVLVLMESKGWIFYRHRSHTTGAVILDPIASALDPSHVHVVEERDRLLIAGEQIEIGEDEDRETPRI